MTPTRNNKRGGRRARQNKSSGGRATISLTPCQASERQLATRNDTITMRGKDVFLISTVSSAGATNLVPTQFQPLSGIAGNYTKFRWLKMLFRVFPPTSSTTGAVLGNNYAIGVEDDFSGEGGSVPNPSGVRSVMQLRCSTMFGEGITVPIEFQWAPLDKDRWFYIEAGGSSSDGRFNIPATLIVASSVTQTVNFCVEIHYTVEMSGLTT
jgi:hypothetical protein